MTSFCIPAILYILSNPSGALDTPSCESHKILQYGELSNDCLLSVAPHSPFTSLHPVGDSFPSILVAPQAGGIPFVDLCRKFCVFRVFGRRSSKADAVDACLVFRTRGVYYSKAVPGEFASGYACLVKPLSCKSTRASNPPSLIRVHVSAFISYS